MQVELGRILTQQILRRLFVHPSLNGEWTEGCLAKADVAIIRMHLHPDNLGVRGVAQRLDARYAWWRTLRHWLVDRVRWSLTDSLYQS